MASPLVRQATFDEPADEDDSPTGSLPSREVRPGRARVRAGTYALYAKAVVADGASARVGATVNIRRRRNRFPLVILDWRVEPRAIDTVFRHGEGDAPPVWREGQDW